MEISTDIKIQINVLDFIPTAIILLVNLQKHIMAINIGSDRFNFKVEIEREDVDFYNK